MTCGDPPLAGVIFPLHFFRMQRRYFIALLAIVAAIAVGVGARLVMTDRTPVPQGSGTPDIGGPFELVDQHGAVRRDSDFRGGYMLVFFGYTFCPDVCPTELLKMTVALNELDPDDAAKVTPVFITVDPARDTVAEMKLYADSFHPRLVALTGSAEQTAAAAKAYRVYYAKVGDDEEDYLVDHSSFVYLMGPDGKYVHHFGATTSPQDMLDKLAEIL